MTPFFFGLGIGIAVGVLLGVVVVAALVAGTRPHAPVPDESEPPEPVESLSGSNRDDRGVTTGQD